MSLFLGENQYFYKKKYPIFCNWTGKVFIIYSFYLSGFKFDAALFNLQISCRVYVQKLPKYFLFLPRKLTFLYPGIFWEMHVLQFLRYQGIVIL